METILCVSKICLSSCCYSVGNADVNFYSVGNADINF